MRWWATNLGLALWMVLGGCRLSGPCSDEMPCPGTQLCLPDSLDRDMCMMQCVVATDDTVCVDGATCLQTGATLGVCYSGGVVPIGADCTDQLDCVRGGICVGTSVAAADARCYHACDPDETVGVGACPSGLRCRMTVDGSGYCDVIP
jgi:hypothetical protein